MATNISLFMAKLALLESRFSLCRCVSVVHVNAEAHSGLFDKYHQDRCRRSAICLTVLRT